MVLHSHDRGGHVYRPDPQSGEHRLTPDATVEATRDAVVHIYGKCERVWAFGRAKVYIHGEVSEVYVLGDSEVHVHSRCGKVDVGMRGTLWITDTSARGTLVTVNQHGTVHAGDGVRVRAYGESRVHAPSTADVVLHWYAQWHTGAEVRGNLSTYRPGYCVVR